MIDLKNKLFHFIWRREINFYSYLSQYFVGFSALNLYLAGFPHKNNIYKIDLSIIISLKLKGKKWQLISDVNCLGILFANVLSFAFFNNFITLFIITIISCLSFSLLISYFLSPSSSDLIRQTQLSDIIALLNLFLLLVIIYWYKLTLFRKTMQY